MNKNSLLSMHDLSTNDIIHILRDASLFNVSYSDWQLPCSKALVANLFFEASTRTHYSFESAELQLGCKVADILTSASSVTKGETLYDTIKTLEAVGYDAVVIRHPQDEYFKELEGINIPILNAGDGKGNHPTQCLLDLLTMLSNGPGDPEDLTGVIETVRELIPQLPVFGICLGCQLIALASDAKTYKLKFGHRGANHPVKNLAIGRVEITSQNHGFAVDIESLNNTRLEMTHQALNDGSCEGVRHLDYPCFAVQYHPEANAGPQDSRYLFDAFMKLLEGGKTNA